MPQETRNRNGRNADSQETRNRNGRNANSRKPRSGNERNADPWSHIAGSGYEEPVPDFPSPHSGYSYYPQTLSAGLEDDGSTEAASPTIGDNTSSSKLYTYAPSVASDSTDASSVISKESQVPRAFTQRQRSPSAMSAGTSLTSVPDTPHQVRRVELWCEFYGLLNCDQRFGMNHTEDWINHHIEHMRWKFPDKTLCWICGERTFGAGVVGFRERMMHIRSHINTSTFFDDDARPDFYIVSHMYTIGELSEAQYHKAMGYSEMPEEYVFPQSEPLPAGQRFTDVGVYDQRREDRQRRGNNNRHAPRR